jgi:Acyl-CoA thioesterase C-terminal domain/Acyl-CoA thioesterase N-terminal domain
MAYFHRTGGSTFRATEHVGGAWALDEQHVAPALGLLAHVVEADRDARRDDGLVVARLSYDILGTMPVDEVETAVRVLRPGRTIELVEATLTHAGRPAVVLRAWLMRPGDTAALSGSDLPRMPGPPELAAWDPSSVWSGGFIATVEIRRELEAPGRGRFWVRTSVPLLDDEPVSGLARAAGLLDLTNGMTVRADPRDVAFPNIDLTAHLFEAPRGEWLGFDTTVSFGAGGLGLTSSTVHDAGGPVGTVAQVLTVRPR